MGGKSEMNSILQGYKQTDIGVIPEDWKIEKLGNIGNTIIGLTYTPLDVSYEGCLILRSSNIKNGSFVYEDNVFVKTKIHEKLYIKRNDIVVCVRNGSSALIGKCAIARETMNNVSFGAFMSVFRSKINHFLYFLFLSNIIKNQIKECLGATINQITNQNLASFIIPLPPLPEQKAIAEVLSDMDALIEAQKELIAKKRAIKQGTMQDLLSGRVRLSGYETKGWKHTDIGDIPNDWEVSQIGKIADIISGGTPKTTEKSFWNGTILWCTPTDITRTSGRYIENTEKTITDNGLKNSSAILLPINSLLLCSRATVGDVRIAKYEITTNQGFKSLVCNSSAYYLFIYYLIPFLKPKMLEKSYGSTFLEISKSNLASIQIQLPSYIEQKTIAQVLSDMDDEIETLEAELEKLNNMKRGMMQELLTGRIRLI